MDTAIVVGSDVAKQETSIDIVFEDESGSHSLVGDASASDKAFLGTKNLEENARIIALRICLRKLDLIVVFKDRSRNSMNN